MADPEDVETDLVDEDEEQEDESDDPDADEEDETNPLSTAPHPGMHPDRPPYPMTRQALFRRR